MRILFYDDDTRNIPQLCDVLRLLGHNVLQVVNWRMLEDELAKFKPQGIIIDLMMTQDGLPIDKCKGGHVTGIYVYTSIIHKLAPDVPFIIYTGAGINTRIINDAIDDMNKYDTFAGFFEKGCDEEALLEALERKRKIKIPNNALQ